MQAAGGKGIYWGLNNMSERASTPIPSEVLLGAYSSGLFPMGLPSGELGWFCPDPRGVIPLDGFHIPHGLRRRLARNPFEIRINTAFAEVMLACAEREETWIDQRIFDSYTNLHTLGFAHSVEAWADGELAGGLYGVALGGAFFGEAMFHRRTDASKVALVALVERLRERGFRLLDIQWTTPHLITFGAVEIAKASYMRALARALKLECNFADTNQSTPLTENMNARHSQSENPLPTS